MKIKLGGIMDSSTLDYPNQLSSVIYLWGCPFRCPWCHNPELVIGKEYNEIDILELILKLKENYMVDAISITGGEPLMQESTIELLKNLKETTNFKIKIDTNCFFPNQLEKALLYLDRIAIDIKAPFNKYCKAVGREININNIKECHSLLKNWDKPIEVRTTIVPGINDTTDDIKEIASIVNEMGAEMFVLQQFRPDKTLDPSYRNITSPSHEQMKTLGEAAKRLLANIKVIIVTTEKGFEEIA